MWHMNQAAQALKQQESPSKSCTMNMRMTYAQYQKLKALGGAAWVRLQINKAKEQQ